MPLISFIIPCYQQARYVRQAVASVLAQQAATVEAVVVDDGSTDDPVAHLGELVRDPRVKIIHQENRGLPAARNRGIAGSGGEHLAFLDADDWLDERFATELLPVLEADAGLGFAYCDLQRVYEGPPPEDADPGYSVGGSRRRTSGDILPALLLGGYFSPNCVLVRRNAVAAVGGFDEALGGHADWDLWLRLAAEGHAAGYVDRRLAYYRIHGGSMSTDREHMRATRQAALRKLFEHYPGRCADAAAHLIQSLEETHRVNLRLCAEFADMDARLAEGERQMAAETARHAELFAEQQRWIAELEEGKRWHQEQSRHWQSETQQLLALTGEQQQWIAELTARKDQLEAERALPPAAAPEDPEATGPRS